MRTKKLKLWVFLISAIVFWPDLPARAQNIEDIRDKQTLEDKIRDNLEIALKSLPVEIADLDPKIRRVAFYYIATDRSLINPVFSQFIRTKITSAFLSVKNPTLVYVPELKPLQIISYDDKLTVKSALSDNREMWETAERLKIDGYLMGELNVTPTALYLTLQIVEGNGNLAWGKEFSNRMAGRTEPLSFKTALGFTLQSTQLVEKATSTLTVPSSLQHYLIDWVLTENSWSEKGLSLSLNIGLWLNSKTVEISQSTFASGSGMGGLSLKVKMTARVIKNEKDKNLNWLATHFSVGRIFAWGISDLSLLGMGLESNLSRHFSLSTGLSYMPAEKETISGSPFEIGGISYEILTLKYHFSR